MGKRTAKKPAAKSASRLIGKLQTERAEARRKAAGFQETADAHRWHADQLTRQIEDIAVGVAGERDRLLGL